MNKNKTIEQIEQNEASIFKYKDFTYLKMAILSYIEKLSLINEDEQGIDEERFTEIQDDIQYLGRLHDIVQRKIESSRLSPQTKAFM